MTALQQAYEAHRAGRLEEAEKGYREALKTQPEHPDALHFLGLIQHQRGQLERAENWIRRALKAEPAHGPAWNSLAAVLMDRQQPEAAEEAVRKALDLDPNLYEGWLNLAQLLLRKRQMGEAEKALITALKVEPEGVAAAHLMGQLLVERGDLQQGLKYLQTSADRQPDDPALLAALARAMVLTGAYATASALLDRAVALKADFHAAWALAVHALALDGQLEQAGQALERAEALAAGHPLTRSAQAALAASRADWPTVLEKLKPIAVAPEAEILDLRNLSRALGYSGFYQDAARIHERMAMHPHARAMDWRAFLEALAFTGQHHRRGPAVEEALHRFPEDAGIQELAALYFVEARQYRQAAPLFRRLHERKAMSVPARLAEVSALLHEGEPGKALEALDALAQQPGWKADVNTLLLRARVLDGLERYPEAAEHLQAAQGALAQLVQGGEDRRRQLLQALDTCLEQDAPQVQADVVDAPPVRVLLVAGLPGSGLGQLLRGLAGQPRVQLLTDRLTGQGMREDFISRREAQPGDVAAMNRLKKRYFAQIRALGGLQGGTLVVDVLPVDRFFDPLVQAVLPESARLWVERDARDLQLHQRFFALEYLPLGVQAPGQLAPVLARIEDLLQGQEAIHRQDGQLWIDRPAQLVDDLARLTGFDGLEPVDAVQGDYLPAGHWRYYRNDEHER